jgi:light-regulated signal transduction histidine kinase (bacteriophytochrome)
MRSKDGNVVLTAVRDISEQRRAQEAIQRQNAQLESANKELDAFSYSVARDLRAPLRAIDGFSQALVEDLQDKLSDESRASLQRVRSATARMAELIDDLLKLARISRYQAEKKQVDLSRLANDVATQLQRSEKNGRRVEFAIKPGLAAIGDREAIYMEKLVREKFILLVEDTRTTKRSPCAPLKSTSCITMLWWHMTAWRRSISCWVTASATPVPHRS